ncbi:MAG: SUMF1/EgtB/PvdO family nonheme iron enzyme [Phycisphaerales bacterium]|nr:SUMF1/EgtB/PvdO family nonheme iron enzyme [Phycisphaerales bacterium]
MSLFRAAFLTAMSACTLGGPRAAGGEIRIELTPVGNAGAGRVATVFRMSVYEVTNAQYCAFLNAVAADDVHNLYAPAMGASAAGGIERFGAPGSYTYKVKPSFADKPVFYVRWNNAARFVNWLENGQPSGPQGPDTTEDGTYQLLGDEAAIYFNVVRRAEYSRWFLPTLEEWKKAAFFDPGRGPDGGWWKYATRSDELPRASTASPTGFLVRRSSNVANYDGQANWNGSTGGNVTTVGSGAASAFGTYDQTGNAFEWTETRVCATEMVCGKQRAGGCFFSTPGSLLNYFTQGADSPDRHPGPDSADGQDFAMSGIRVAARCEADLDRDGLVTSDDFLTFLNLYEQINPEADLNADGVVDFIDLLRFMSAFDRGC